MGLLELLIVVVLLLWLFGYFGRGRFYGSRGGTVVSDGGLASGGWIHTLLVIVVILIVLRLLGVHF
jgi:TM2 domain-containing membrane protein YozV